MQGRDMQGRDMATRIGKETEHSDALAGKTCTPCRGGIPPLTPREAEGLRELVPQWELGEESRAIERTFRFGNFREALAFVARVGELAEAEAHHPDMRFGWGYATVRLQTKKIKGLHENDFIMAAKIDRLGEEDRLDQAVEMTFPASDPIAVGRPTGTEAPMRSAPEAAKSPRKKT